ncbi:MAG: VCBS repeat-containing protein [Planctomycetes bacterium]|nr:VCBS repeat-containing protein [Planctomycetota bacterium]
MFSAAASAQIPFQATTQTGLPTPLAPAAIAVGDVDDDGDIDILLGNSSNGPSQLLLNDGNGRFVDGTAGRLPPPATGFATHSIDLVDTDGDGDLDIVIGNAQNLPNQVLLNDGTGVFSDAPLGFLPANAVTTVDQILGDFDNDGDIDWFLADRPNAHLWLNAGPSFFTDASANLVGLPQNLGYWYSHGSAADLDDDGDLDLLVPAYPLPVILWNQGNAVFQPAATPLPMPAYFFGTNRATDLDGDGDLDLLLDNCGYVLLNDGHGNFTNATTAAYGGNAVSSPAAFDVDGDGFMDVLTTTTLWRNNGNAVFTAQPLAANIGLVSILHTVAADFDGDGDLDLAGLANFRTQVDAVGPPVRGLTFTVDFHVRTSATSVVAAFASWGASLMPAGPLGILRLDPVLLDTITVESVTASPLRRSWTIPNWSALVGVELHYQALVIDPITGPHLTNAWHTAVQ